MNDSEKKECEIRLGTSDGVTMDDYFERLIEVIKAEYGVDVTKQELQDKLKQYYPSETNWSF
tara:strand:- start:340 stop:525 length:186 start_codon:yes stop_codon:yes gene_type:complete